MQETFGLRDESAFKAASGMHGGMGRGDVCGSLTGANLMMGLMFGSNIEESVKTKGYFDPAEMDVPTKLVSEIYDWFGKEFGSVKCCDIHEKHMKEVEAASNAKGLTEEEKMDRIHSKCDELCGKTAARAAEIIWDAIKAERRQAGAKKTREQPRREKASGRS